MRTGYLINTREGLTYYSALRSKQLPEYRFLAAFLALRSFSQ